MAAAEVNRYRRAAYQTGTAAPKLPAVPEKELRKEKREQVLQARTAIEARVQEKRRAANEFSALQVLAVLAAAAVLVAAAGFFIVQLSTQESSKNAIERLELEIQTVHHENVILQNLKNSSIDYEKVYTVATEEYGMTIPMKQQVVHYDQPSVEFVHKYGDIPR